MCNTGQVEDTDHFLSCRAYQELWQEFERRTMRELATDDSRDRSMLVYWYHHIATPEQRRRFAMGSRFEVDRLYWPNQPPHPAQLRHGDWNWDWLQQLDEQRVLTTVDQHFRQFLLLAWRRRESQCGVFQFMAGQPVLLQSNSDQWQLVTDARPASQTRLVWRVAQACVRDSLSTNEHHPSLLQDHQQQDQYFLDKSYDNSGDASNSEEQPRTSNNQ